MGDAPVKRAGEWEERYGVRQEMKPANNNPQYTIITSYSPLDVSNAVSDRLSEGWKLYGELQIAQEGKVVCYAQAMTRKV